MPCRENDRIEEARPKRGLASRVHNVRYVLLLGTLAVIVLFAIAYVVTRA
ncbi:MAG: hypothetical protein WBZ23_11820 [Pseudolabrys sp.]|jgi:hypothetical protein